MKLIHYLQKNRTTLAAFATDIGVTESYLSKVTRGKTWVSGDVALRIRNATSDAVMPNDLHDTWVEGRL